MGGQGGASWATAELDFTSGSRRVLPMPTGQPVLHEQEASEPTGGS